MIPNFNTNGPCFELFNAQIDIIKYWKLKGKISKEFDSPSKSYVYILHFGGVSSLSTPIDERRSLQINNSCLLFQFILYNTKSFSIEICVRDKSDTKRRFNITSSVKEVDSKPLYIKIPFINYPLNIWTNLLIDLSSLIQSYFKIQTFKTLESIHITGNLKIRKIFSLRTKDDPVLKSVEMGKVTPLVNFLLTENGNVIYTNIKILGVNNITHINTVNIDSKLIQSNNNKRGSPSPQPNNKSKYPTTSDITLNRHKQMYQKKNKEQNCSINNININININNLKKEQVAIKIKDNKAFMNKLPHVSNIENQIKNKKENTKFKKFINNIKSNEEGDNSANNAIHNININNINNININNAMKNNYVEKKKSLGNYMQSQKNRKRNKSNNPFLRQKINNKKNENSVIKEDKSAKKLNVIFNAKSPNKKIETKGKKENIKKSKEINNESSTNDNNYYDSKEKEISLEDYSPETNVENKFKFNNIYLGNSLVNKNQPKEEEKEAEIDLNNKNNNKQNKFSNYNMLLESGIDIKNIPVYDNIEEVAEWPGGDWNTAQNIGIGDKVIKLDYTKKTKKKNENINIDDDLLEFNNLEKKETYRPYTPPIEELVQVNPDKMKGNSYMKVSLDKNIIKRKETLKNYENLIYDEEKGLLFDPITNKYYDIKAK